MIRQGQKWRRWGLCLCWALLTGCPAQDQPLVLGEAPIPGLPSPANPGSSNPPVSGCLVNFFIQMQLKVSANPPNASGPLEILDAEPFAVEQPIPLEVSGNEWVMKGEGFPPIYFRPPETAADLKITAAPGTEGRGTYNPDTGEVSIKGFKFALEIVQKGGIANFLPGSVEFPPIEFTTGEITASGNLHPIVEQGKNLDKTDRHLILVMGLTLPIDFTPLGVLNDIIGGGALTARLEGVLDQLPEQCSAGGGSPPPVFGDQPTGLRLDIEGQGVASKIDFGPVFIQPRKINGQDALDCREAEFRGVASRMVTMTNTGPAERVIQFNEPKDLDGDRPSPLCSGRAEFVRGTVRPTGAAHCESVKIAGKDFSIGTCRLPSDGKSSLVFPILYAPFNYQVDSATGQSPADQGELSFLFGEAAPYTIQLFGQALPDFREVFSISRVKAGTISAKDIRNGGLLKLSTPTQGTLRQDMVLQNTGGDAWKNVSFSFEKGNEFTVHSQGSELKAGNGSGKGYLYFALEYKGGPKQVSHDRLHIKMEKGSDGSAIDLVFEVIGAYGLPPLKGKVLMHFDYFTAMIDHVALSEPIESNDFRERPEFAPTPFEFTFEETEDETIRRVTLHPSTVNLLDPSLTAADREKILRIFTARASYGKDGNRLDPGDSADKCYEPSDINRPYKIGDCSYFYWTELQADEGYYDDESGHLIMPSVRLNMQNPYHADIFGIWPASNPNTNPNNRLNTPLWISFSTHILDARVFQEDGPAVELIPDPRVGNGDLSVKGKRLGKPCPEGYLDGVFPHMKCYLSLDERYLKGHEVSLREGNPAEYDVVFVGIGRFEPGTTDPNIPWFLGDNGGSLIYIAIQGRLVPE